jgi:hypothetical protein
VNEAARERARRLLRRLFAEREWAAGKEMKKLDMGKK